MAVVVVDEFRPQLGIKVHARFGDAIMFGHGSLDPALGRSHTRVARITPLIHCTLFRNTRAKFQEIRD
jgi:hypothetical protein